MRIFTKMFWTTPTLRQLAIGVSLLLLVLSCFQLFTVIENKRKVENNIMASGNTEADTAAHLIDAQLRKLEPLAKTLAQDLSSGTVQPQEVTARLIQLLNETPDAFRMGVIFLPYAASQEKRLYAPYVKKEGDQLIPYQMEDSIDYTEKPWYEEALQAEGWGNKPHMSQTTNRLTVGYTVHFKLPQSKNSGLDGMVRIDMDMLGVDKMVAEQNLGKAGYGFILAQNGTYMSHPTSALVSQQKTIVDVAEGLDLPSRQQISQLALQGKGGYLKSVNPDLKLPIIVIVKPIPSSKWVLGVTLILDENASASMEVRRSIINLACTLLAAIALAGFVWFRVYTLEKTRLWHWSSTVSLLFALGVCLLWTLTIIYPDPPSDQAIVVMTKADMGKYVNKTRTLASGIKKVDLVEVPTGIYLETLRFEDANDVVVTGYVWQKFRGQAPTGLGTGFVLPDAEQSKINEMFRRVLEDSETVFYSFEATIRQKSENNAKYPLDQTILRLRILPKVFGQQILLIPDLEGYQMLNPATLPGVDKQLVLPGWQQMRSYFGFVEHNYRTNFGLHGVVNSAGLPELCFDFVVSREFIGPFISNILPVCVVACILFSLLMCGTRDKDRQSVNGFKTTDVLRGAATLLFPIMFAQISLRTKIAASDVLYMEYFYFIMYAVILMVAANVLVFTHSSGGIVHRGDNVIPKLLYWPMLTGAFFMVSLWFLY